MESTDGGSIHKHDMEIFESTHCDALHDMTPHKLPVELSAISSSPSITEDQQALGSPNTDSGNKQLLRVYLRVRPFSKAELENDESQGCITLENSETAVLRAPKGSCTMKNSEKGICEAVHRFTFTQIFGPETTQTDFFNGTMKDIVNSYLTGENGLVFTYGVTNAGKTFTIQGAPKDPGILPRSLALMFSYIKGKQYLKMDFKPHLSNGVMKLDDGQIFMEESLKSSILNSLKEESDRALKPSASQKNMKTLTHSASHACVTFPTLVSDQPDWENVFDMDIELHPEELHFSVWVSFYEIYNEYVYDLLDTSPLLKKRLPLKVCEDQMGNSYLKDLTWINVCNLEEACRILKIGNKNRSLACTKLNQQSSRSHSIFSVKLLRISKEDNPQVLRISQLSLCDLAGSERCNKTETIGDRLKEAGNINNSLLILGKCIAALRQNQHTKVKQNCIPFRESKLTRLFQAFFCGKGKACMIVNINQCASLYDETLHVMKFSAVARQVVQTIQPKSLTFLTPRLVGKDGKPISKTESVDALSETYISDDDLLDSEDDVDTSILESKDLLKIIDSLKEKLITERQNKLVLEAQIRNEMGEAMLQQLMETEEMWSKRLEELKESYEEKMDSRFDMYKEAVKRHARLSAQKEVTQNYVTMEEFLAEQKKVLERDRRISMLEAALDACRDPEGMSSFFGCSMLKETEPCDTVLNEAMMEKDLDTECDHKELCSIVAELEQQCEKKDKVIETLRTEIEQQSKSLHAIEQTLKEKIVETDDMKKTMEEKEIGFKCAKQTDAERILELENSISELKEILDATKKVDLPSDNDVPPKRKKGLFANLKSSMAATSPKRYALRQALSKSVLDTPTSSRKQKGQKVDEQNI